MLGRLDRYIHIYMWTFFQAFPLQCPLWDRHENTSCSVALKCSLAWESFHFIAFSIFHQLNICVVRKLDNAIHRINHYPVDSEVCFVNIYRLDSVIQRLKSRDLLKMVVCI